MSKSSLTPWILILGLVPAACAGEAVGDEFGQGYKAGAEPPPPSQGGESTPAPNFPTCEGCNNACVACFEAADEDDPTEVFGCLQTPACRAFLAQFIDPIDDYGSDDGNIIGEGQLPSGSDCEDLSDDDCAYCVCVTGGITACSTECGF